MIHDVPICFGCQEPVSHDPVFAAPCDHAECPSVVWHPLHLMEFRENRERARQDMNRFMQRHEIVGIIVREREEDS